MSFVCDNEPGPGFEKSMQSASQWPGVWRAAMCVGRSWIEQPRCVVGALYLSIDEAVDRLVTDDPLALFAGKTFSNLFRRPATGEAVHYSVAQRVVAFKAAPGPSPGLCLRLGIGWLVANFTTNVAAQLARDGRWLAIQSCSDFPD